MKDQAGRFLDILKFAGRLIPGEHLRTAIYLNCLAKPRKFMRNCIRGFYRMDHVYDVCTEFERYCEGNFSILEFGVADGYSFTKILYATRYLGLADRVLVHGFDTFEGLPDARAGEDDAERALVTGEEWIPGHYRGRYEQLNAYCQSKYSNFVLHKGLFEETLNEKVLATFETHMPILIWIDCDYYHSTRSVFDRLTPYIPTGCVVYFDDIYYNFGSRFTGEMRAVWEINHGALGEGIELVRDAALSLDTDRVYRFINVNAKISHRRRTVARTDPVRYRTGDDSPFP